jgi:adenylyltransferase/sulfurtransferase
MGVLQALEAVKLLSGAGQVLAGRLLLFDGLAGRFTTIQLRGRAPGCAACAPGAALTRDSIAAYDYAAFTHGQQPSDGPPTPLQVLPAQQRITPSQLQELITPPQQPKQQQQQQPGGTCPAGACGASGSGERLLLLDVRPPEQFHIMALPGAVNVPFLKLEQRLPEVLQLCGAPEPAPQQQQQQQPEQLGDTPAATPAARVAADSQQCRVVVMCRRGNHSQLAVARLRELGVAAVDVAGGYEAWAAEVDAAMPVL